MSVRMRFHDKGPIFSPIVLNSGHEFESGACILCFSWILILLAENGKMRQFSTLHSQFSLTQNRASPKCTKIKNSCLLLILFFSMFIAFLMHIEKSWFRALFLIESYEKCRVHRKVCIAIWHIDSFIFRIVNKFVQNFKFHALLWD